MKKILLIVFIAAFANIIAQSSINEINHSSVLKKESQTQYDYLDIGTRASNSLIYSIVLPGAGHTYFGHELKGAAISVAYFGSIVTAILANNNFKAREERIEILTQEYLKADKFANADKIWSEIQTQKNYRDINERNRTIFTITAAAIWAYGIFDLIYFTDDIGDTSFSMNENSSVNLSAQLSGEYTGIALKINLP